MKANVSKTKLGTFEYADRKPDPRNPNIHYLIFDYRNIAPGATDQIGAALDDMNRVLIHEFDGHSLTVGVDVTNVKQEQMRGYLSFTTDDVLGAIETTAKSIDLMPKFSALETPRSTNHRPGYVNQPPKPPRFTHRH